jgi:molybdopterin-binding protein
MPLYRLREAAHLLGVSPDTVRRWADAGRLTTTVDDAGHRSVEGAELAAFAQSQGAQSQGSPGEPALRPSSLRNRFPGIVTRVIRGDVAAQVEIQAGPHRFVSLLTREAVDELDLAPGDRAVASVKSTSVSVDLP